MRGTKRCDRCWELEKRIKADPDLARAILLDRWLASQERIGREYDAKIQRIDRQLFWMKAIAIGAPIIAVLTSIVIKLLSR